ncbi:hypothetical protein O0544_11650 [Edwardsiella anguillarum]|nr:hypothetical protein [Edwardsiella anguillarum]
MSGIQHGQQLQPRRMASPQAGDQLTQFAKALAIQRAGADDGPRRPGVLPIVA